MKRSFWKNLLAGGLAVLLAGCSVPVQPTETTAPPALPILSEAMNHNRTVLPGAKGDYPDWVEVYNPGTEPLSLEGYALSDSEKNPRKWEFPAETQVEPGGFLLVICSGEAGEDPAELCASFGIARGGEPILLCDPVGQIVSRLEVPEVPEDISVGVSPENPEQLLYYPEPTPGAANGPDGVTDLSLRPVPEYSLKINEYTTSNSFAFYDQDGDCPAWAEIRNVGREPVEMAGLLLSDDPYNLNKWAFPEGLILEPGAIQLVLLSGKDRWENGELHADFRLGREDSCLILSDPEERSIDRVPLVALEANASYGLTGDGSWAYFARPTPGTENTTPHFPTLSASTDLLPRQVWISEALTVSAGNDRSEYAWDWVELFNGSRQPVDLTGWGLSDSSADFQKYVFPQTELAPGAYLVLTADGREPTEEAPYQMGFSLDAAGETLYLTRPDGTLCDRFDTGRQIEGVSSGRPTGPEDRRLFFYQPTPGEPNSEGAEGYTRLPVFSRESIYLEAGDLVELQGEGEIHYTLNGSRPSRDSALYEAPIAVTENVTIRAAAFADDRICGGVATHTYVVDPPHDLAVACLSTAPRLLFDDESGIYSYGSYYNPEFPYFGANFWGDHEVPVHFEFYENGGDPGISFDGGVRIFGQYSRAIPQKSLSVHMREIYGPTEVRYPFFPDNPVTEYHDILLRTSGQDWKSTKLRDGLGHCLVKDVMDLDLMDYRPVALYINGEYWGLYNLRDKINEQYLYTHRGVDPDNVDLIKCDSFAQSGDRVAYDELMDFLRSADFTDDANYEKLVTMVDEDEVMDYWITEIFFANTDTGNIKMYRERTEGAKWRLILFDLDWGLFPSTYYWNMLKQALDPEGHGYDNMFPTHLLRGLTANARGRDKFIRRFANHLNTTFAVERTTGILHQMADTIRTEIPRQYDRWYGPSPSWWEEDIAFLEEALAYRRNKCVEDLQKIFDLSDSQMEELFPNG